MEHAQNIGAAKRLGRLEGLANRVQPLEVAVRPVPGLEQQAGPTGPGGRLFRFAFAPEVDLVKVLLGSALEGDPAKVAGTELQDPRGNQGVSVVKDRQVRARGLELAIGEELGHHNRRQGRTLGNLNLPLVDEPATGLGRFLGRLRGLLCEAAFVPAEKQKCQHEAPVANNLFACRSRPSPAPQLGGEVFDGPHGLHPAVRNSDPTKFLEPLLLLSMK